MSTLGAWRTLAASGLGRMRMSAEFRHFFRETLLDVVSAEGWLDFLRLPRTPQDLASRFGYTDLAYLERVLSALGGERIVERVRGSRFRALPVERSARPITPPAVFPPSLVDLWTFYGYAIPGRLREKRVRYTQESALSSWRDALTSPFYNGMRATAFAFADVPRQPITVLDVGSGSGNGTAQLWSLCHRRGLIRSERMRIVGVEPDPGFLKIAVEHFPEMVANFAGEPAASIERERARFPQFVEGTATGIPFPDATFDCVFASHMLYLTDPRAALAEMLRVTKPGGIVFGTQSFLSKPYTRLWTLFMEAIDGAHGFFSKADMARWARQAGAARVAFATPISAFKITKAA